MNTAQYYREPCSMCGRDLAKRDMNKLLMEASHTSCTHPKKICFVCDDCLPKLLDYLGASEPETPKFRAAGRFCHRCYNNVGKRALFCPYCGEKLTKQSRMEDP